MLVSISDFSADWGVFVALGLLVVACSGEDSAGTTQAPGADTGEKKKASKPIYKQWWFWVVAGISVIILIDFATQDSVSQLQLQVQELGAPLDLDRAQLLLT